MGKFSDHIDGLHASHSRSHRTRSLITGVVLLGLAAYVNFGLFSSRLFSSESQLNLATHYVQILDDGLQKCMQFSTPPVIYLNSTQSRTKNPRWNDVSGQKEAIILRNVTLFDGSGWADTAVDIAFERGIITKVAPVALENRGLEEARIIDANGGYVTPGLVDMHSHHLVGPWPGLRGTEDTNEVNDLFGPLTPFVRSLDSIKPYDIATDIIRSGGVTSSLILPGSANIMGGEAYAVKNVLNSGAEGEENVEEMLLEYGIDDNERRRYMKMACGENPRRVYKHTRMGNAWVFRKHLERSQELRAKQDNWCLAAEAARQSGNAKLIASLAKDSLPEELELESSIGLLRGQVGLHNHCYEPEDFEDMLRHSKEFGFHIHAFHHAISAWKVPELIKASGQNITIATFSDFGLYKKEGYDANLFAGKILEEHGVPVAYKSDHGEQATNAKYLLFEAQNGHQFGLSERKALQSVTSVPAASLRLDHRIGYVKAGYDADLVIWDSHPLSVGATPLQVYVDGRETLDEKSSALNNKAQDNEQQAGAQQSRIRPQLDQRSKEIFCTPLENASTFLVTGIKKSLLDNYDAVISDEAIEDQLAMFIQDGEVICIDSADKCVTSGKVVPKVELRNGHALPGLVSVTTGLGLVEIFAESSTADGTVPDNVDVSNPDLLIYAKYGVHLDGKTFRRAQIGGVTRAVTIPHVDEGGFGGAVSAGIKTNGKQTIIDGGIFHDDVAIHFTIGQGAKSSTKTVSASIAKLRKLLLDAVGRTDSLYGNATAGDIPVVIHVQNKYDILQLVALKKLVPKLDLVIFGGGEAPLVADELSKANIPVIFTQNRGAPDTWERKDILTGPPLSLSPAAVLHEANVTFALAIESSEGNSFIHNLPIEASWAAKYMRIGDKKAVDLVSKNVETILKLKASKDIVIWEGNPLEFGASPVIVFDGETKKIVSCWPSST